MTRLKTLCKPFCMIIFLASMLTISTAISKTFILPLLHSGENRTMSPYEKIEISGAFVVTLNQGTVESVIVDAPAELLPEVITKVENGTLKIYSEKKLKSDEKISLVINFKTIKELDCSGAVKLGATTILKLNDFSFEASGACKSDLELTASKLDIEISGAGNTTFRGTASKVNLDISGAGKYYASALVADDYKVDISGTGNAEINAVNTLDIDVSGTGNVKYKGEPKVSKQISGVANVSRL